MRRNQPAIAGGDAWETQDMRAVFEDQSHATGVRGREIESTTEAHRLGILTSSMRSSGGSSPVSSGKPPTHLIT